MDRTVKVLLGTIVVLLTLLLLRPQVKIAPEAQAENRALTTRVEQAPDVVGYRTALISTVNVPKGDKVRNVLVIDSAQSFVVQYDDRMEVFRVNDITATMVQRAYGKPETSSRR